MEDPFDLSLEEQGEGSRGKVDGLVASRAGVARPRSRTFGERGGMYRGVDIVPDFQFANGQVVNFEIEQRSHEPKVSARLSFFNDPLPTPSPYRFGLPLPGFEIVDSRAIFGDKSIARYVVECLRTHPLFDTGAAIALQAYVQYCGQDQRRGNGEAGCRWHKCRAEGNEEEGRYDLETSEQKEGGIPSPN